MKKLSLVLLSALIYSSLPVVTQAEEAKSEPAMRDPFQLPPQAKMQGVLDELNKLEPAAGNK